MKSGPGLVSCVTRICNSAYSFHENQASLEETYWRMHEAYSTIFDRLVSTTGPWKPTQVDGGSHSHEFHMLADSGGMTLPSQPKAILRRVELAEV